jgi:hypothetical protein
LVFIKRGAYKILNGVGKEKKLYKKKEAFACRA